MTAQNHTVVHSTLTAQQQSIVAISSLTASGDLEHLKEQLGAGLDAGLTINEIKEILVQMYAYCGFPRSLNGISTLMKVLEERTTKGMVDKTGKEATQKKLLTNTNREEKYWKHLPKPLSQSLRQGMESLLHALMHF